MNESTNSSPSRTAIYVRSATEQFNPGHLEDQERRCRAAIAEQVPGCVLADDCVFFDVGTSGMTASRPGLDELLMKASESPRPFDRVVIASTDRIGRSFSVVLPILNALRRHGVEVFVVDPRGRLRADCTI